MSECEAATRQPIRNREKEKAPMVSISLIQLLATYAAALICGGIVGWSISEAHLSKRRHIIASQLDDKTWADLDEISKALTGKTMPREF